MLEDGKFYTAKCFNKKSSAILAERVLSLRGHFIERNRPHSFYTLGTSTYLDLKESHGANAVESNARLEDNFAGMYEVLMECMSEALGEKVMFGESLNVPGFQIFDAKNLPPQGIAGGGSIHRDYPDYSAEFDFNYIRPISFTCVIKAPGNGAGLNYWDEKSISNEVTYFAAGETIDADMMKRLKQHRKYLEYEIGELVISNGHTLHQVANMVPVTDDECRITIQGHGVLVDDGYVIYF